MRRARRIIEAETGTLVIHLEDRSTDFLKAIYEGRGYPVISGATTRRDLAEAIKSHERIFMLGHGSPSGLFARGLMIGDDFGPLLAEKSDGLYIWCNADAYAVRNKLSGLVSGMFISEVGEARMFGIEATQREVNESNAAFSQVVREIMDRGGAHEDVRACYANTSASCQIRKFNSERLYVFSNGTPSPALHPTSYGLPREEPKLADRYYISPEQDGLDANEEEWLVDYLAKNAEAAAFGQVGFNDAVRAIETVLAEFLPHVELYYVEIADALEDAIQTESGNFDGKAWAHEFLDRLA